jgi:nicotinamidase-related amidase
MTKRVWDDFLTEQDKAHLEILGPRKRKGFGSKPAILNIDNYRSVAGDEPMDILEMIKTWPSSMGNEAWEALDNIADLLATARDAGIPVAHVRGLDSDAYMPGRGHPDTMTDPAKKDRAIRGREFMPQAAPVEGEIVLEKASASAFFGTPLMAALNAIDVDTLIVTGESASGCVRASVVDACTYRFNVIVAEECVYDRHEACRAINLFDMNQKYADVMPLAEIKEWIAEWVANKAEAKPEMIPAV